MMNLSHCKRIIGLMAALGILIGVGVSAVHAQNNRSQRTPEQIMSDINTAGQDLLFMASPSEVMSDPERRAEAAPRAIPALRKMIELFDEMHALDPQPELKQARTLFLAVLDAFGDEKAAAELKTAVGSEDVQVRMNACTSRLIVGWWTASKDAEAQSKVLDELEQLAAEDAENEALPRAVMAIVQEGAATPELRRRAEQIIVEKLKGPMAEQAREHLQAGQEEEKEEGPGR